MEKVNRTYRMIISGGGTGGHIYPAVAIADEFKRQFPDTEILFIGASDRMEMDRVPKAGYPIEGLWISGLQRRLTLKNLLFPIKLIYSLLKAGRIISRFKPDIVVGTGGFASGPTVMVANRKNIPVLIQEQNSYPGLVNRQAGSRARKVCVAYEGMEKYFAKDKIVFTGNPVRQDIDGSKSAKLEALTYFGLKSDKPVLLVLGGSLGARTINDSILKEIEAIVKHGIQVIWQTGSIYYDEIKGKSPRGSDQGVYITKFIDRMDLAYAAADLAVSRAGALSVSELCISELPVIFVPSPNVAENHQNKNAMSLVKSDAALLVEDNNALEELGSVILELASNVDRRIQLSENIKQLAKPKATTEIVNEIKALIF